MTTWITKSFTFLISVFSVDRKWLVYAEKLEARIDAQDAKLEDCKKDHAAAAQEALTLRVKLEHAESEIKTLRQEVTEGRVENANLKREVAELKYELKALRGNHAT